MRRTLFTVSLLVAAGMAAPVMAQPYSGGPYEGGGYHYPAALGVAAGAAAGTTVALGAYNGWWSEAALPATTAGSIAVGGVAAIGALAMTDAVFNPCAGFHALFDLSHGECVDGHYVGPHAQPVGYAPAVVHYRHVRHYRHHRYER
ncbi:MAG TPA: hypothetical protein VG270_02835 [Pseudolabrys sp.]|nr:hypothetical protein [Pseudolabrys sp.]